ncbi:MAG: M23 family metallopeptidase [Paludibacteraceae bacterium]|nr:M23 family metallopeptidase [Paludibacteraceae bacterium]
MRNGNNISFFQRIRMKYKVSVLNENTLEEVIHWRVSALRFVFWCVTLLMVVLALFSTLILTTPLRDLLPENVDVGLRKEVVRQAIVMDSLVDEVSARQAYISTFRNVVMGNIAITDTTLLSDSVLARKRDEMLIEKSEKEQLFCENFEQAEQYNLASASQETATNTIVFMNPVKGIVIDSFSVVKNHLGIDIQSDANSPVLSAYQGVVLFAGYNPQEGYIVQIIHPNQYISVYKGAEMVYKKSGDIVKTGEVIAAMGNDKPNCMLHFELWSGMQALNPSQYIVLE